MIHFYLIVSGKEEFKFQAELFIRSISFPCHITICGEGNAFLKKHAEIIPMPKSDFDPEWYAGLTCIPQKGDVTIYADADILLLNSIDRITSECRRLQGAAGVIAYASPKVSWKRLYEDCGVVWGGNAYEHIRGGKCPFYVNLGFVAIPSDRIPEMNRAMDRFLRSSDKVYPGHYHRPQFAMCLAIEHLRLPKISLPLRYNCPDLYDDVNEDAAVVHMLHTKSEIKGWADVGKFLQKTPKNKIVELVRRRLKVISI